LCPESWAVLSSVCFDDCDLNGHLHDQLIDAQPGPRRVIIAAETWATGFAHADPELLLGWLFRLFNRLMGASVNGYVATTSKLLRVPILVLIVYVGLVGLTYTGFHSLPTGFIPLRTKVI
jgi:multidrug efflux pump subunit AcrB